MRKFIEISALLALAALACMGRAHAATSPIQVNVLGTTFILPLQKVKATQLYSFRDKRGYPGAETVIAGWGSTDAEGDRKVELSFGAAPVLGTAENVPFVALQRKLPASHFDVANNSLMFGVWIGKESDKKRATYGVKASVALW